MSFVPRTCLIPVVVAAFWSSGALAAERKAFELEGGDVVVGEVIDEGDEGYLVRTPDGKTVRVTYANIVQATVLGAPPPADVASTTDPAAQGASPAEEAMEAGATQPVATAVPELAAEPTAARIETDSQGRYIVNDTVKTWDELWPVVRTDDEARHIIYRSRKRKTLGWIGVGFTGPLVVAGTAGATANWEMGIRGYGDQWAALIGTHVGGSAMLVGSLLALKSGRRGERDAVDAYNEQFEGAGPAPD